MHTILTNDQICYQEDPSQPNEYKQKLASKQTLKMQPLRDFMLREFGVQLKVWYNIPLEE
jgi:hypothetical protein